MNKDDMSDDAEFDAFLKGEGDLSRRLQSMRQSEPSAAMDAAILARARLAMEQERRPAAANDPGDAVATPRLAPSFGQRWKIPMGIAATALAGVFATQAFNIGERREPAMSTDVEVPAASVAGAPAEQKVLDAQVRETPAPEVKAPAAPPSQAASPAAPALEANVASAVESRRALERRSEAAAADKRIVGAPAPPAAMDAAPAAAPPEVQEYSAPMAKPEIAATAPRAAAGAPAPAAPAPAPLTANRSRADAAESVRVEVTGSRIKRDSEQWLVAIERLIKDGQYAKARQEWDSFRIQYPYHTVAPELEAKLEALEKQ